MYSFFPLRIRNVIRCCLGKVISSYWTKQGMVYSLDTEIGALSWLGSGQDGRYIYPLCMLVLASNFLLWLWLFVILLLLSFLPAIWTSMGGRILWEWWKPTISRLVGPHRSPFSFPCYVLSITWSTRNGVRVTSFAHRWCSLSCQITIEGPFFSLSGMSTQTLPIPPHYRWTLLDPSIRQPSYHQTCPQLLLSNQQMFLPTRAAEWWFFLSINSCVFQFTTSQSSMNG